MTPIGRMMWAAEPDDAPAMLLSAKDAKAFVVGVTGKDGLCLGVLTKWDSIRIGHGALSEREWIDLAYLLADHVRRTYPALFGPRGRNRR